MCDWRDSLEFVDIEIIFLEILEGSLKRHNKDIEICEYV
jgi:hypothetical protein